MKKLLVILLILAAAMLVAAGIWEVNNVNAIELQNVYGYTYYQALTAVSDAKNFLFDMVCVAFLLLIASWAVNKFVKV